MADRFVISTILKVLDQSTQPLRKVGRAWGKLSENIAQSQKKFQAAGKTMTDVGKKISTRVGLPLAGFGALTIKTASQFQESMNRVGAITGATEEAFKSLEAQAKELGASTQFSASQAADAMTFLGMAGLNTEQIMAAMPGTLQLAAAGGLELADAADIATNVMTSMGIEANNLGKINDVLAKTASSANTDIMQLAEAMRPVAPAAANLGISLESLNAMLGKMADAGERGGIAGTLLRNAMLAVVNPSKKMTAAMQKAGINLNNFVTESGQIKDFDILVKRISESGLSTGEIFQAFGERGARAIQLLTAEGKDLTEFTKQLESSEGTAKKMQDRMMKGLPGAFKQFKSAFEAVQLSLVNSKVSETLEKFITGENKDGKGGLTGLLRSIAETSPELMSFASIAISAGAALGPILMGIGQFMFFAPGLMKAIGGIGKAFLLLGQAIFKVTAFLMANPIVAVIAAIALAAFLIIKYWKPISKFFSDLWDGVVEIATWAGKKIFEVLTNPGKAILDFFQWVMDKIGEAIGGIADLLPDFIKDRLGIKTRVETEAFNPEKIRQSISETKSSTDVTINVKSDEGTIATVEKVSSKGTDKPKINTESFLGGFAGAFTH